MYVKTASRKQGKTVSSAENSLEPSAVAARTDWLGGRLTPLYRYAGTIIVCSL